MFNIPLVLPSKGFFGLRKVVIKPPSVEDISSFISYEGKLKTAINSLVNSVCDSPIGGLTTGDRDYIFLNLRNLVNPSPIEGSFPCSCGQPLKINVELKELKVIQLPDDFKNPSVITLPVSGDTLQLTLLTVDLEDRLEDYLAIYARSETPDMLPHSDLSMEDLRVYAIYASMICTEEDSLDDKVSYLRKLPWYDYNVISLFDSVFSVGVIPQVLRKCPECGKEWNISIPLDKDILGVSAEALLSKHRYLAKTTSIGYKDFLKYTFGDMNAVVEKEIEYQEKLKMDRDRRR